MTYPHKIEEFPVRGTALKARLTCYCGKPAVFRNNWVTGPRWDEQELVNRCDAHKDQPPRPEEIS